MTKSSIRVLIAEDEPELLDILSHQMTRILGPCEKILAKDGQEALDLALEGNLDLIITDFKMPVLNGVQFITQLRIKQGKKTPVVFVSGFLDDLLELAAKDLLAEDVEVLPKPYDEQQLGRVVRQLLQIS